MSRRRKSFNWRAVQQREATAVAAARDRRLKHFAVTVVPAPLEWRSFPDELEIHVTYTGRDGRVLFLTAAEAKQLHTALGQHLASRPPNPAKESPAPPPTPPLLTEPFPDLLADLARPGCWRADG